MLPLRFVPYHLLGDAPNVIVDGSPTPSTRLTLSHWPGSPTPVELRDDLSAQIAFRALDRPSVLDGIDVVSNNHFDQDGLASVVALVQPDAALDRRAQLVDVARAGDFGTFHHRDAVRVAFALAALADPARSPLGSAVFEGSSDDTTGRLYEALSPRLIEMIDRPDTVRDLWADEDEHLAVSLDAIERGVVQVVEHAALDLAVVTVPESWAERQSTRFTMERSGAVHPSAVYQSTGCFRVLVQHGRCYRLELRYETWVMYRSRPVLPRPDLRLLAERLNGVEPGSATWRADAPGALTPLLQHDGESGIDSTELVEMLADFLRSAPPAWDPYAN